MWPTSCTVRAEFLSSVFTLITPWLSPPMDNMALAGSGAPRTPGLQTKAKREVNRPDRKSAKGNSLKRSAEAPNKFQNACCKSCSLVSKPQVSLFNCFCSLYRISFLFPPFYKSGSQLHQDCLHVDKKNPQQTSFILRRTKFKWLNNEYYVQGYSCCLVLNSSIRVSLVRACEYADVVPANGHSQGLRRGGTWTDHLRLQTMRLKNIQEGITRRHRPWQQTMDKNVTKTR